MPDILLAAQDAREFAAGLDWQAFSASKLYQNAIICSLEILGEAASKVSSDYRRDHPDIPWSKMIGMRNGPRPTKTQ